MDFDDVRFYLSEEKYNVKYSDDPRPRVLPKGYVTDREKSVAWNEDQVLLSVQQEKAWLARRRKDEIKARDAFRDDVISAIMDELGCNKDQADVVFGEACERGHSYGYHEVLTDAESACEFISRYVKAEKGADHE